MPTYRISGRTAATTATLGNAAVGIWNPHATQRLLLIEFGIFATTAPAASASFTIRRITARGTVTTSLTPTLVNDIARGAAPPSGALLDLAYSAQPTLEALNLFDFPFAAAIGSGMIYPTAIEIPPGAGIVLAAGAAAIIPICTVWFKWIE
ncbi:MAG TPA: hypothetical protein VNM48_00505 [Chloroflexota bacterium]|nr:hypothetical protein [Chloroflexota bacterium]